jgi:hypothetical protein
VVLDPRDGSIVPFFDKEAETEMTPKGGFGVFKLATESRYVGIAGWKRDMSAWFTGRFKKLENLNQGVELRPTPKGQCSADRLAHDSSLSLWLWIKPGGGHLSGFRLPPAPLRSKL